MAILIQHLRTTNDTNGNPRRLWAVYDPFTGDLLGAHDEGWDYSTARQVSKALYAGATHVELPTIVITPTQYRDLLKR